jgi:RNA polymerase sigma-70 factor (ECF subfamily)
VPSSPAADNVSARSGARTEDARLVARCLAGEEDGFQALVDRYGARCARLVGHFLDDRDEAADVVQEAFSAAFANLRQFDPAQSFWPWLARMATNRVIDRLRSAQRQHERPTGEFPDATAAEPTPDAAAADDEERQRVRAVLGRLPHRYRVVLVLREMEEMSAEEIGAALRRPAATVRWRLFKARRLFRQAWDRTK